MKKRKRPMEIVFWVTLISLSFAFVGGILIAWAKLKQDKSSSDKSDRILNFSTESTKSLEKLGIKADTSLSEILLLKSQITALNQQLIPFKNIAKSKYPSLTETEGLKKLQNHISEIESRTIQLQEKATELENKVKPRELSEHQKNLLYSLLNDKRFPIFISSKMMDTECFHYAEQISKVLEKAGWSVFLSKAMTSIIDFQGIGIFSFPDNNFPEPETELLNAFAKAEIKAQKVTVARNKMGEFPETACIVLIVGSK